MPVIRWREGHAPDLDHVSEVKPSSDRALRFPLADPASDMCSCCALIPFFPRTDVAGGPNQSVWRPYGLSGGLSSGNQARALRFPRMIGASRPQHASGSGQWGAYQTGRRAARFEFPPSRRIRTSPACQPWRHWRLPNRRVRICSSCRKRRPWCPVPGPGSRRRRWYEPG